MISMPLILQKIVDNFFTNFFEPQHVEQLQQLERKMNHEGTPQYTKEGTNGYEGQKLRASAKRRFERAFVVKILIGK